MEAISTSQLQQQLNEKNIHIANLEQRLEQYRQAYEQLQHQVNELLRHRFGRRSERFIDSEHPQQLLFPESPTLEPPKEAAETTTEIAAHTRRRKKNNTSNLPTTVVIIPVADEDRHCVCGGEKQIVRYETKQLYDYQPAVFQLIEQRREIVACPKGCERSMTTAPAPRHILPKVKATESLLAYLVISKCRDRQPLYHLEQVAPKVGISRETMARWLIQLESPLRPIWNLLKDEVVDYDIASIDATSLQVLKEPGRAPTTKSYAYCLRGGPPEKSVVLYGYNHSQHQPFVADWLTDFRGTIHLDADVFFNQLLSNPEVKASYCHAHARRYFDKVKQQAKKQGLAHEALRFYKKLYTVERQAKTQSLTTEARYQLRQHQSAPLLAEFKHWLDTYAPQVLPQSPLGKAFRYALTHWTGLTEFLNDGRLEIDNNLTEQQIKPFVMARKNFLFADSMAGANALCLHFSLVRTALLHQLDPYEYYVALLKQIPHCQTVEDYEKLLPWNIELAE